jgi:fumarate reductase subunit C
VKNSDNNNNITETTIIIIIIIIIITIIMMKLDSELWYEPVPKSIETSQEGKAIILWNQQVQTNRPIPNNKPDTTIQEN